MVIFIVTKFNTFLHVYRRKWLKFINLTYNLTFKFCEFHVKLHINWNPLYSVVVSTVKCMPAFNPHYMPGIVCILVNDCLLGKKNSKVYNASACCLVTRSAINLNTKKNKRSRNVLKLLSSKIANYHKFDNNNKNALK